MPPLSQLENFQTLANAFRANAVALVQWSYADGQSSAMICAINRLPDGSCELVPFASMLAAPLVLPPEGGTSSPFSTN
jgi:hypothetical protein